MVQREMLEGFHPDLDLIEYIPFWNSQKERYYRASFRHKKDDEIISIYLYFYREGITLSTSSVLPQNKAELTHLDVYYANELMNYLNQHPKMKMRSLLKNQEVTLGECYNEYIQKGGIPLKHWLTVERSWREPMGLFFLLYIISMIPFLFGKATASGLILVIGADLLISFTLYYLTYWREKKKYEKKYPFESREVV